MQYKQQKCDVMREKEMYKIRQMISLLPTISSENLESRNNEAEGTASQFQPEEMFDNGSGVLPSLYTTLQKDPHGRDFKVVLKRTSRAGELFSLKVCARTYEHLAPDPLRFFS